MKQVIVTVSPDEGEVKIEAVGFVGSSCAKATEAIEKALGKVKSSARKPEFFQANQNQQKAGL